MHLNENKAKSKLVNNLRCDDLEFTEDDVWRGIMLKN